MIESLNYLQGRDKMVRDFKFFHGHSRKIRAVWMPETDGREYYDVTEQLTRHLSDNIAEEIDNDIIRTITRRINGGGNDNGDYLNYWLNMGGQRA
jgi:hypothetical protein